MAIKEKKVTITVCDICGKEADGECFATTVLNGRVYDERCPFDLCKNHMYEWYYIAISPMFDDMTIEQLREQISQSN